MSSPSRDTSGLNDLTAVKSSLRAMWMAGDFGEIAKLNRAEAERFVSHLDIQPNDRVLDVACGTGNVTIPAARKAGGHATGVDIAPNLLEQARLRAAEESLSIEFIEGDAEALPFAHASFDWVTSMFGAMFAPRHELTARELMRVCRPGGRIAMANWPEGSFAGAVFQISAKHVPPPPGVPVPERWGDERIVRELFAGAQNVQCTIRDFIMDAPVPPELVFEKFRSFFGPVKTAFERLPSAEAQHTYRSDFINAIVQNSIAREKGRTIIPNFYLEVIVTR